MPLWREHLASLLPHHDVVECPGHALRLIDGLVKPSNARPHLMIDHHLGLVLLVLFVFDVEILTLILKVQLNGFQANKFELLFFEIVIDN